MGKLTGGDPSLLRKINSSVVLRALRDAGDAPTLSDLVSATGLSRPTIEGVLEGLAASGLVVEAAADPEARRVGRPARRFRFRSESGHTLGIGIGAHRVQVVLADLAGRRLGSAGAPVAERATAETRLGAVDAVVTEVLASAAVDRRSLRAAGVGTPGVVGGEGTVALCTALPGWTGLPLGDRLREALGCTVLLENDANAAVLGEHWAGAAAGCGDVVMVLAGLSPGAGSLIGGRLHRGHRGAAGEIGALHLLGRELTPEHLLATDGEPLLPLDEAAVSRVFAQARAGERGASGAVDRFSRRVLHDVTALVLALDPELVVIGGWAAGLEEVLATLRRELPQYCLWTPRVELSALGEDAVATGALRLALDRVEDDLFRVGAPD
ncbi:ROK family transcriptional regulator [Streptomyces bohaiensis]|uniref:ROK family protein n=2 Tax=Streptomyces bohaiensis TaxID=1431344 RepID=A0ABX1C7Q1_9ACTN|nr:ROK family protein [Streptomyces bohaiensis]NJQ15196.1 ROK family protein [Streptomyces bohaiensis]